MQYTDGSRDDRKFVFAGNAAEARFYIRNQKEPLDYRVLDNIEEQLRGIMNAEVILYGNYHLNKEAVAYLMSNQHVRNLKVTHAKE